MRLLFVLAVAGCTSEPVPDVATGEVAAWQTAPALPVARANHCSAAIADWVLVIGGNRASGADFVKTDEIDAAQVAADGTLGPWQVAGHLPSPVSECNATSDGQHLYVIDGLYDDMAQDGKVFTADLDATGLLGAVTALGALPAGAVTIATGATVHDGTLLVMEQLLPASGNTVVTLRTPLAGIAWSTDDWKIGFHAQSEYAFSDSFAYSIGGYVDPAVGAVADVYVAPIDATGAIGTVTASAALPTAVAFGQAVAVDGWVFVAGGRAQVFGAPGTTAVYAAPIAADGSLGAWQTAAPLPMARANHSMVVVGDYLVLTGGAANGPGDTTVLTARVRYPASATSAE